MLTQDCPVGIAAVRRRMARTVAAGIVGFAALFSATTQWWTTDTGENLFAQRLHYWAEKIHPTPPPVPTLRAGGIGFAPERVATPSVPAAITGEAMMGDMVVRVPNAPAKMGESEATMGKMRLAPGKTPSR